ncbi:molybdenum ABC transporter permease, partial [bacterium]|nr:molybdenum ABC transporter permease [bacterium]
MTRRIEPAYLIFSLLGGVVLLFIVAPLIGIFVDTSADSFLETMRDSEVSGSIWLTLFASMGATLICATASIPFAYILARKDFPFKGFVNGIIDLPIVIPHSAAGIALLGVLSGGSLFGGAVEKLGIEFVGSTAGIMAAMAFVSIPF